MKKIGDIIGQANTAAQTAGAAASPPMEPRLHRISVSYMVFAELHVTAETGAAARDQTMTRLREVRRKFRTDAFVYRTEVKQGTDAASGNPIWVEIDRPGT